MKNLSYILLALLFTSCSMEEDPRDQIPEEEIYTSATDLYRNTIATLYTYVGGAADGQGLQGTFPLTRRLSPREVLTGTMVGCGSRFTSIAGMTATRLFLIHGIIFIKLSPSATVHSRR